MDKYVEVDTDLKNNQDLDDNNNELHLCGDEHGDNCANQADIKLDLPSEDKPSEPTTSKFQFKLFGYYVEEIKWVNLVFLVWLHLFAVYGFVLALIYDVRIFTVIFVCLLSIFSGLGMSVGGHRLWAHKSFKAHWLLRLGLLVLQTMTLNGSALSYARDHRTHHKWTDQEMDPKNPSRGMFYAHIGWWLLRKKQIVKDYGTKLDFSDLYYDLMLVLQHKYYYPLAVMLGFVVPSLIPWLFWRENLWLAFLLCGCMRVCVILHHLFTVNSLAHYVGVRPYTRDMRPTENHLVIYLSLGEGNHNYHHTFPWDYRSSELQWWEFYTPSTVFIKVCQLLGLASDLKKPSKELVHKVVLRKGIPEYFESYRKRSLFRRIIQGLLDWTIGFFISMWPLLTIVIFKAATFRNLIVLDPFWEPYTYWLRSLWFTDNFVVYY